MIKNNSYGLIEVLICTSIFTLCITGVSFLLNRTFVCINEIENLRFIWQSIENLTEQLQMQQISLKQNAYEQKVYRKTINELIYAWLLGARKKIPGVSIEVIDEPKTIQINIKEWKMQFAIHVAT